MPTPFMHLRFAENMRAQAQKDNYHPLVEILEREWPAFYLGSVAADFQTIDHTPRAETHFYEIPPAPEDKAYPLMFASYPALADGSQIPPDQAVFVAAYCVHLTLDLLWFQQVLIPYFFEAAAWGDSRQRHLVHHILLTYLDRMAFEALPPDAAATLASAQPRQWLPFASDKVLIRWRDFLLAQLQPGATLQTVKIYAGRLKMSAEEFSRKLQDPDWIEDQVFRNIPVKEVEAKIEAAVPQCIELVATYLKLD
jgi:hypothetical protein